MALETADLNVEKGLASVGLPEREAKDIGCRGCGRKLAESRGGRSVILAIPVKRLG